MRSKDADRQRLTTRKTAMDPFLGEIRMFAGTFAPVNWHLCDGSILPVSTYTGLFSLLGGLYGGDGSTTFGIPDLRGRVPVGQGQGTGLTNRLLGQTDGESSVTVGDADFPAHTHAFNVSNTTATTPILSPGVGLAQPVVPATGKTVRYAPATATPAPSQQSMQALSITYAAGGGLDHDNLMPYLAVNYIICVLGLYPTRPN